MGLKFNQYQITVLKLVDSKGEYSLDEVSYDLKYDIPKNELNNTLDSLLHKNLLINVGDEDNPSYNYKISDEVKNYLHPQIQKPPFLGKYLPMHNPINPINNRSKKSLSENASKILLWIFNHIIALLLTILAGYIIYHFGWNK